MVYALKGSKADRIRHALRHLWKMGSVNYTLDFLTHRKLSSRKGECLKCGKCCGLKNKCEYLGNDNRCTIYGAKNMSQLAPWCFKDCPYGLEGLVDGCGYYWEKKAGKDYEHPRGMSVKEAQKHGK